ncbi:MAG: nucleotidyltransferase family protein [Clostridia bacterium]|nr:nucleotidyltransferase family protein [Deltaproteobacteria bacterium]
MSEANQPSVAKIQEAPLFVAAVLLAGGKAERLGMPKGLVPIRSVPLLELQLQRLVEGGVTEVVLAVGPNRAAYDAHWPALAAGTAVFHGGTVHVAEDLRSSFGPFGSLQSGIARLAKLPWVRLLVLPIDIPCASADTIAKLLETQASAVVPRHDERGGHPVVLARAFAESLMTLDPATSRLDDILRTLPSGQRLDIEVDDPTIHVDLNTAEAVHAYGKNSSRL